MLSGGAGAWYIAPDRSRRRPVLAGAMAVAAAACLALGLFWGGVSVVLSVLLSALLAWLWRRLDARLNAQDVRLRLVNDGQLFCWCDGVWQPVSDYTILPASNCLQWRLCTAHGVHCVNLWRDAVTTDVWRQLSLLSVRRQVEMQGQRAGGSA